MSRNIAKVEEELKALQEVLPPFTTMEHLLVNMQINDEKIPVEFLCNCGESTYTELQFIRHILQNFQLMDLQGLAKFAIDKTKEIIDENEYVKNRKLNEQGQGNSKIIAKRRYPDVRDMIILPHEPYRHYKWFVEHCLSDASNPEPVSKESVGENETMQTSSEISSQQKLKKRKVELSQQSIRHPKNVTKRSGSGLSQEKEINENKSPEVNIPSIPVATPQTDDNSLKERKNTKQDFTI